MSSIRRRGSRTRTDRRWPTLMLPVTLTAFPRARELSTSLSVRTYGALNGSGKALNRNPKLSSIVSA